MEHGSLIVPKGLLIDQASFILDFISSLWPNNHPPTRHQYYLRLNFYTFHVQESLEPRTFTIFDGPSLAVEGHAFLTGDQNIGYIIQHFLQFDASNCGPKVQVGPGPTTTNNIGGQEIWSTIPALVLKNALLGLIEVGFMGDKAFIIQVCSWDIPFRIILENMLFIWSTTLPSSKKDSWLLVLEVHRGAVDHPPFYDFLDSLQNTPFQIEFKAVDTLYIVPIMNWVARPTFNQSGLVDSIKLESYSHEEEDEEEEEEEDEEETNDRLKFKSQIGQVASQCLAKDVGFFHMASQTSSFLSYF